MTTSQTNTEPSRGPSIDPILTEVIFNQVLGVAEEMASTLIRTAYSPNVKQRADCSTAVLGLAGEVLAQAPRIPIHLGSMIGAVQQLLKRHPLEVFRPGDMFIANDPYSGGGQHLPDINMIAPVFVGRKPVAFVANIAHHADVGGMVAGSEAVICRNIFQEGLRLPPVQVVREGNIVTDISSIVTLNSRTPEERRGDLLAQIAANRVGVERLSQCYQKHGCELVERSLEAYLDATERRFRAVLSGIPDSRIAVEDFLDPDIYSPAERIPIRMTLEKCGNRLIFDFDGTSRELTSARNVPQAALYSTIYCVSKMLLDPGLASNSGYFRAIEVKAPKGSVLNPSDGSAVGARALACAVIGDVVASAISEMVPERALAGGGPHHQVIFSGKYPNGKIWVNYETFAGAQGARPYKDGADAVRIHASGASNLPVEALEQVYPLRVVRYELRDNSGGLGRQRGGMGVVRQYQALTDMTISVAAERQTVAARGVQGGKDGSLGEFVLNPGTNGERRLKGAVGDFPLSAGDVLEICTPGGGGFGSVDERDRTAFSRDRTEGRVSAQAY
jgi:N-methylhydantoinase B